MPSRLNLAPRKFQEKLSGASRMQENLLAAFYSAPPDPIPGGEEAGCPLSKNPTLFWPRASAQWVSALIRNRTFDPSEHDGPDPPMNFVTLISMTADIAMSLSGCPTFS